MTAALAPLIALCGGLWLYITGAAPSVQGGDSGEFQFVAHMLGIPHPPGYPFYAVFGKLWSLAVPAGEVAYRMNLMSAAFAAATLAAVAFAGARSYGVAASGLLAALWLAVAPTWWSQATIASVRPMTGFFVAATLAVLAAYAAARRPVWLYAAAASFGFGLTHHISLWTLAPALGVFVLVVWPGWRIAARAVPFLVLPLVIYAYLPIRSAMGTEFDASHPTTLDSFLALVTGRAWAGDMFHFNPLSPERLDLGLQIALTNFGAVGAALASVGLVATAWLRPRWALLTGGVALTTLVIGLSYRAPVIADYLIPVYIVAALWIAALPAAIGRLSPMLGGLAVVLLAVPAVVYGVPARPHFDLSGDRADQRFLSETFALAAPKATILADWYHSTILWYGQLGLDQRRDLNVDYVGPEGDEVPWLRKAEAALTRGPVYSVSLDPRLAGRFHLQRTGPLYQVLSGPARGEPPADARRADIAYGDAAELLAYRLEQPPDGADVAVSLYWRAGTPNGRDLREFVHLADGDGKVWGQRDGTPGEGAYPTNRWQPGETIAERYAFVAVPAAPATLGIRVGLYETLADGWRRLPARSAIGQPLGDAPEIAQVMVTPPAPPLVGVQLGKRAVLRSWTVDRERARPGESVRVVLDWLPISRVPEDLAVFVHLVDGGGRLRAQNDGVPVYGGLPTLRWAPGRPVRDTRELRLPGDLPAGQYEIRTGMYAMSTGAHLPVLDEALARGGQGDHLKLTTLVVAG